MDSFSHFNVAHHTWDVGIVEILSINCPPLSSIYFLVELLDASKSILVSRPEGPSNPSLLAQLNKIIVARSYSTSKA